MSTGEIQVPLGEYPYPTYDEQSRESCRLSHRSCTLIPHFSSDIQLFILGNFLSTETNRGDNTRPGERIKMTYEAMNAENLIKSEIEERKGHTVVSCE